MFTFPNPANITPQEFERTVHAWFEHFPEKLHSFDATHLESHTGVDGDYEIDVTIRFTAFDGADFLVLCECKKHSNPIERGLVQILNDKKRSLNAQKAIMVATAAFQSGSREYAKHNRIALIEIANGSAAYITNAAGNMPPAMHEDPDPYCGMLHVEMTLKQHPDRRTDPPPTIDMPMRVTSWDTFQLEQFLRKPDTELSTST